MTKDEAKKIFYFYKENCSGWSCTRRDLFVGFYYFEKSKDLVLEYIRRLSSWKKDKGRYVSKANYTTLTINDNELKEVLEKMQDYKEKQDEIAKKELEKQLTLF